MFTEQVIETPLSEYEIERDKPMPSKHHAFIQSRLLNQFDRLYAERYTVLPELTLDMPIQGRVPDLSVYPYMKSMGDEEIKMVDLPLCTIEILSPTPNHVDLLLKRRQYFDAGVQSYWLVFPDPKSVYVYSSPDEFEVFSYKEILTDTQLGIELPLSEIFK